MKILAAMLAVGLFAVAGMLFVQHQHTLTQERVAEENRELEEFSQQLDEQAAEIDRKVRFEREMDRLERVSAQPVIVSMDEYSQLKDGMSYREVVAIIGNSGEESARTSIPGIPETVAYMWANPDGSNMNATFQGDRLVLKAQAGLK